MMVLLLLKDCEVNLKDLTEGLLRKRALGSTDQLKHSRHKLKTKVNFRDNILLRIFFPEGFCWGPLEVSERPTGIVKFWTTASS